MADRPRTVPTDADVGEYIDRDVEFFRVGFAPRKAQTVVYVGGGFDRYQDLLPRLGAHSTGKACLYLRDVQAADREALRELVRRSYAWEPPG